MRLLGISFGRNDGNCDAALRLVLKGAMENGRHEITMVNTCNMNIDRCTGCWACDRVREKGGMSVCLRNDDFAALEDLVMEADGVILAAPVYVLGPTGQYKNFVDRIGPSHDRSQLLLENDRRRSLGWSEDRMIPAKYFKQRPLAVISVGGARTKGWTSMGVSAMMCAGFPTQMIPVDAMNLNAMGDIIHPCLDESLSERLKQMGRHIAEAAELKPEAIEWKGDEEGICPICHCDQITFRSGTTVECTVCGSIGTAAIENDTLKIKYPAEQLLRSRYRSGGNMEHILEIKDMEGKAKKLFAATDIAERISAGKKELEDIPVTVIKNGEIVKG